MSRSPRQLQILPGAAEPELTPEQKRFNQLIAQIEAQRARLAEWNEAVDQYRRADSELLHPLRDEWKSQRRQWAFALDEAWAQPGWTKTERATLSDLVCECVGALLGARDSDDAELKVLYERHAQVDFETEQAQVVRSMKKIGEAVTGLDLGDDADIRSEADLMERLRERFEAHEQEQARAEQAREEARGRRRPARKSAAQKQRETETKDATQSVREVFRKLASALHPDRETDPEQRAIKTAQMQKVNQAYAANDLLTLLELQLQVERIEASRAAANADPVRLKHYSKVLGEQLAELKQEIVQVEQRFRLEFGLDEGPPLNPQKLGALLNRDKQELRAALAQLQQDLHRLRDKPAARRWLKQQRQYLREMERGFPY